MKKTTLILLLVALFATSARSAKDTVRIVHFKQSALIPLAKPYTVDTTNLNKVKPDSAYLLKLPLLTPPVEAGMKTIEAPDSLLLTKPTDNYGFQVVEFLFTAQSFLKLSIETTTAAAFELYVDNKLETTKHALEDSVANAGKQTTELTLEPKTYRIVYKLLTAASQDAPPSLKVALTLDSKQRAELRPLANDKRMLSLNDILDGTRPSGAAISPNGQFALIRYTSTQAGAGTTSSHSEVIQIKPRRTLLKEYGGRSGLAWMPKSNLLYFTRKTTDNRRELLALNPQNGEESVLCSALPEGHFSWSPCESYLIFSIYELAPAESGDLRRIIDPADRQPNYRNRYFLHKFDLQTGLLQPLTFGTTTTSLNHFSADGSRILFSTFAPTITQWPLSRSSYYVMDVATLRVDTLMENVAHISRGQFSPDGNSILFFGTPLAFDGIGKTIADNLTPNLYDIDLYLMNLSTRAVEPITRSFNPSIASATWSRFDPNTIYLTTDDQDYVRTYTYRVKEKKIEQLPLSLDIVSLFDPAKTSATALYFGQGASSPWQVYAYDTKSRTSTLLAYPQQQSHEQIAIGELNQYNFNTADGTTIYGRYYLPPNFDPTKKYPMIVYYYGGTTPVTRMFEQRYPLHLYAAMGYVVYNPQPSGAIGFGQEFAARHVNAWGERTADEIIEGTKRFCEEHTFVDASKIGCIGASYGGFMTQYLLTRTNLFATGISHAGISALASYWGEGYWGYSYSSIATANNFPWNNAEFYTRQSPLFAADKITSPLLLLHGAEDTNVPVGESIQMFTALKMLGKEVEFIEIKGENHAIMAYKRRMEWNKTIFAWFAKQLQGKPEWWNEMYSKEKP